MQGQIGIYWTQGGGYITSHHITSHHITSHHITSHGTNHLIKNWKVSIAIIFFLQQE